MSNCSNLIYLNTLLRCFSISVCKYLQLGRCVYSCSFIHQFTHISYLRFCIQQSLSEIYISENVSIEKQTEMLLYVVESRCYLSLSFLPSLPSAANLSFFSFRALNRSEHWPANLLAGRISMKSICHSGNNNQEK